MIGGNDVREVGGARDVGPPAPKQHFSGVMAQEPEEVFGALVEEGWRTPEGSVAFGAVYNSPPGAPMAQRRRAMDGLSRRRLDFQAPPPSPMDPVFEMAEMDDVANDVDRLEATLPMFDEGAEEFGGMEEVFDGVVYEGDYENELFESLRPSGKKRKYEDDEASEDCEIERIVREHVERLKAHFDVLFCGMRINKDD